jgi:hypothetical protein
LKSLDYRLEKRSAIQQRQTMPGEQEFKPVQSAFGVLAAMTPSALLAAVCQSCGLRQIHQSRLCRKVETMTSIRGFRNPLFVCH